jgi:hypothetical protein
VSKTYMSMKPKIRDTPIQAWGSCFCGVDGDSKFVGLSDDGPEEVCGCFSPERIPTFPGSVGVRGGASPAIFAGSMPAGITGPGIALKALFLPSSKGFMFMLGWSVGSSRRGT